MRNIVTEEQFTPEDMIAGIELSMGSVVDAAATLGCDRITFYRYARKYPQIREALDKIRESYKVTCAELARDNHLKNLIDMERSATNYELDKLEPKDALSSVDITKYTDEEIVLLKALIEKGKRADGSPAA